MKHSRFTISMSILAGAAFLLLGTGTAVAESKQDTKPAKEAPSEDAKKEENKILKKKRMHEERLAAAARFKAASEKDAASPAKEK